MFWAFRMQVERKRGWYEGSPDGIGQSCCSYVKRYKTYISLHYNTLQFNSTTNSNSQNDRKVECLLNSSNKN